MKNILSGSVLLIILFTLSCASKQALFSPFTQRLIRKIEIAEQFSESKETGFILSESDCKKFLVTKSDNAYSVDGTIIVSDAFSSDQLETLGIGIKSERENSLHITIPVIQLDDLGKIPHILRIEIDSPVKIK